MRSRRRILFTRAGGILFVLGVLLAATLAARPVRGGSLYMDSGQMLGGDTSYDVALGDIDGDTDQDAVVANQGANRVWINSGSGAFSPSAENPGVNMSGGVALADLDGDTDLDIFVANRDADNEVWLNNGSGVFTDSGQVLNPGSVSNDVVLGDLDGDNDQDAVVANNGVNQVWLNDGAAQFSAGQALGSAHNSLEAALGDLNGDDEPDIYFANGGVGVEDQIWFNDGGGSFTADSQTLDLDWNEGVALGDLDGDTDLDVYLATWFGADAVWLNDGNGVFTDSGQALSGNGSLDVTLVDVDDDTDLDALVAKNTPEPNEIWLNDGSGMFTLSAEGLDDTTTYEIAAGDLDGDMDADLFAGNFGPNQVWFRGGIGLPAAWFEVEARPNPAGQVVYPWAQPGDAQLPVLLAFPPAQGVEVIAAIESSAGVMTDTLTFPAGQDRGDLSVANPQPDPRDTMTITLSTEPAGNQAPAGLVNPLQLVFVDADQGDPACWLCFADWLLQLLGFEPSFWALHHMQLSELRDTPSWNYYSSGLTSYTPETTGILATHPPLLWDLFDTLELWTPGIQAYEDGQGDTVVVTQAMVDSATETIAGVQEAAGPALADWLEIEMAALDVDTMVGMTFEEVAGRVLARAQEPIYLPIMHDDSP